MIDSEDEQGLKLALRVIERRRAEEMAVDGAKNAADFRILWEKELAAHVAKMAGAL